MMIEIGLLAGSTVVSFFLGRKLGQRKKSMREVGLEAEVLELRTVMSQREQEYRITLAQTATTAVEAVRKARG